MHQIYSQISGWGKYVPDNVVTNFDLEKMVDTSHDWVVQRTGIEERRIATKNETTGTMAVAASQKALSVAGLTAADLDLIIVATSSPDYFVPAVSSTVQAALGANCPAFTVMTGCTGFVYALVTGHQFIATGAFKRVLVVGVELISRFIDWNDRNTCVLFGDGAGAVVLTPSLTPRGVLGFDLGSNGELGHNLILEGGGCANPFSQEVLDTGKHYLQMNGREVFKFATRILPQSTAKVLQHANLNLNDIDMLIPHQANARIIELAIKYLGIDPAKVFVNVNKYGNTSAASIPIALVEALEQGRIKADDKVALVSFGAGLTWASAVVQWGVAAPSLNGRETNAAILQEETAVV
ncbi:MAG: 3-oxoacyl-[acyl-carrier-protein] synthase 3 protein 1 [Anaerolineae bacterium]|nr:3-oxoacyl-[acyl-carrier-protein] synthase 3 protein 1 [Anaerolineae bacterium]